MKTYQNFVKGIAIVPKVSTESNVKGEIEFLSSTNKLYIQNGSVNDPIVTETVIATLTNKTLTSPVITTPTGIVKGDVGLGNVDNTSDATKNSAVVTLTNKTISGASNTLSNIANASLTNSSLTINGTSISLGGSATISASNPNVLTIGTGLSGTSYDGSAPITIAIDTTVVTKTGTQTLTNKTLTSPVLNTPTADTITGIAAAALTIQPTSGQNLVLSSNGVGLISADNITFKTNTIASSTGAITINPVSGSNLLLNGSGTGTIQFLRSGSNIGTIDTAGLTLASGKTLVLTNNSQTITLQGSASASASYAITYPAAAPASGTAMIWNGSTFVWGNAGGWTTGTSLALTAGGTVSISLSTGQQVFTVASSGGAVALSVTPFGSSAPSDGTVVRLIGTSDTNTVSLSNNDAAKGCILNGPATLAKGYVIELQYMSSTDRYYEALRNF